MKGMAIVQANRSGESYSAIGIELHQFIFTTVIGLCSNVLCTDLLLRHQQVCWQNILLH